MKHTYAIFLLLLGELLLEPRVTADVTADLKITVRVDKATLQMSDVIELDVHIANVGRDPEWLFGILRWGNLNGLILHVSPWGPDGALPLFLDHASYVSSETGDRSAYVQIAPGTFLGTSRRIEAAKLVRRPGQYRLWVEYVSPVPASAFDRPFWSHERGSMVSSSVVLDVCADTLKCQ